MVGEDEKITISLRKSELSKIFIRCWDLLEKDTQEMLKIVGLVENEQTC
ncbi:MAG: hypothetical protein ABIH59_02940 [archaeon]